MSDIFEKAMLLATGLERKAKEALDELVEAGRDKEGEEGTKKGDNGSDGEELPSDKAMQNRIVEDGVKASKELIALLKEGSEKFEKGVLETAEVFVEKLNVATKSDLDTVMEMARKAREKVDELEKRVAKIEGIKGGGAKGGKKG